jgi:hypothetical protein
MASSKFNPFAGQITFKLPERIVPWPVRKKSQQGIEQGVKESNKAEEKIDPMFAKVACSPPLGQATVIEAGNNSIRFTVLLETDPSSGTEWQVALWHNLGASGDEWSSIDFTEISDEVEIVCSSSCVVKALNL